MAARKISRLSWRAWLRRIKPSPEPEPWRVSVLGVGHELMGDDAAGVAVVRAARAALPPRATIQWIEAGPAPESFSGPVSQFKPQVVLIIDAAQFGLRPGQVAWVEREEIDGVSAFTHGLPLSVLAEYLVAETGCRFGMLAIQAEQMEFGQPLSPAVRSAVRRVSRELVSFFQEAPIFPH